MSAEIILGPRPWQINSTKENGVHKELMIARKAKHQRNLSLKKQSNLRLSHKLKKLKRLNLKLVTISKMRLLKL